MRGAVVADIGVGPECDKRSEARHHVDTLEPALPRARSDKSVWLIRKWKMLWCTIRHMSASKKFVVLRQMRYELDARVSIGHRLSCSLDTAVCLSFLRTVHTARQRNVGLTKDSAVPWCSTTDPSGWSVPCLK